MAIGPSLPPEVEQLIARRAVGARVVCPKCGESGRLAISVHNVKGRDYCYWVVNHSYRKCYLRRASEEEAEGPRCFRDLAKNGMVVGDLSQVPGFEAKVTRSDSRRGKVYVPASMIGKRVKIVPLE